MNFWCEVKTPDSLVEETPAPVVESLVFDDSQVKPASSVEVKTQFRNLKALIMKMRVSKNYRRYQEYN